MLDGCLQNFYRQPLRPHEINQILGKQERPECEERSEQRMNVCIELDLISIASKKERC